jgi:hypothetical protein
MGNPQTWNRYAYVANTPLNATDPLGLLSHWSDVGGTGRWLGTDGLRDPGGAWLSAVLQSFQQQLMELGLGSNPVQQGLYNYLTDIDGPGTSVGEFNLADEMLPTGTDCAALVNGTAGIASTADNVQDFMDQMASTFTAANNSSIGEMYRTQNMLPRTTYGDSGFKQEFQDPDPYSQNQVRHFVGGLVAGYQLGAWLGLRIMNNREVPGNPDTRVNAVSTALGADLVQHNNPKVPMPKLHKFRGLATKIRKLLCG